MSNQKEERTIALAGLLQAAQAVVDLSKTGMCDERACKPLINSLFVFDPKSTLDVYGNEISSVESGLSILGNISNNRMGANYTDCIRYALGMLAVQKQLARNPEMLNTMSNRLKHMQYKNEHFPGNQADTANSLSGLYQDTLSTLKFRIQITGNMQHLKNSAVSDRIRAMLFAGIRSAMLWRQLGGTKLQLIFGRGDLEKNSKKLLNTIPHSSIQPR